MTSSTWVAHDGKFLICFTEYIDDLKRVMDRRVITFAGEQVIDLHVSYSDTMLGRSTYHKKSTTFKIKAMAKAMGVNNHGLKVWG